MRLIRLPIILLATLSNSALAQAAIRDSAGVRIVENPIPTTLPVYRRVVEPASVTLGISFRRNELFGSVVGAIQLSDGTIVVADGLGRRLRLFNPNGHLTRLIGHQGDGPGDFQEIVRLQRLPGDTIAAWDRQLHRESLFAPKGKLLGTTSIALPAVVQKRTSGPGVSQPLVSAIGRFADGRGLATSGHERAISGTHLYSDSVTVWLVNKGGGIRSIGEYFTNESYVYEASSPPQVMVQGKLPFGPHGSFAVGPKSWYYTNGYEFEIREHSPEGVLLNIIQARRRRAPLTDKEVQKYSDAEVANAPKKYQAFQAEVEDWMRFPKLRPAYRDLVLSETGELWAELDHSDDAPASWDVFEPTGPLIGSVATPAGCTLLAADRTDILCEVKNSDDVETVQMYRLAAN